MPNQDDSESKGHSSIRGARDGDRAAIETYRGPLPPPHFMEDYKAVDPELYRTVIDEFKTEARHRRRIQERESGLVRYLGLGLAGAVFLGAGILGSMGFVAVPVAMVGAIGAVIGVALWSARESPSERLALPPQRGRQAIPSSGNAEEDRDEA